MHDDDLDTLLRRSAITPTEPASRAARDLAASVASRPTGAGATQASDRPRARGRRKRWLVPGLALGTLALTGAGSLTAYQMSLPPFISMTDGDSRTAKVPVDMLTRDGTPVECGAYLDYRDLSPEQTKRLKAFVAATDWKDLGQRHYDALSSQEKAGPAQGSNIAADRAADEVVRRARQAVPGLTYLQPKGASITMSSTSCDYPNGAPK